jgi:acetoin utilization deacetylase AcuC-like enzyme
MIKIAYSERFVLPLPPEHRFPMLKYELVKEQLIYEGTITENQIFDPGLCDMQYVLAVHDQEYVSNFVNLTLDPKMVRRIGFPLTEMTVKRCFYSAEGTRKSAINALEYGIGLNIAGGTHHAYKDRGEGFCMLNDIAIAAQYLLDFNICKKILVIDLDVHQGNGTAKIFENEPRVFTFSMHGQENYPLIKEKSDLDIALPNYIGDREYLALVQKYVHQLIEEVKPDFIFYQAGVDILESDKLGKISVSLWGCKQRDQIVLNACYDKKIPVAVSMGGGYSEDIKIIVEAHCNTFRVATQIYT